MILATILNFVSAGCAFLAGIFWFQSARVELPTTFPLNVYSMHHNNDDIAGAEVISEGSSPEIDALGRGMISQSRLSAKAAGWACAAALTQAGALIVNALA